jgi:hypothetical protein
MHFFEHVGKRQIPIETSGRLSGRASLIVIGLCALAAWGLVLGFGAALLRITGV